MAYDCGRSGVLVLRSDICHEKLENGAPACRNFGERDLSGSDYGSLPYENLARESQGTKRCEEKHKGITAESF